MFSYISLIMTLAFTLAGDALFSVAIIWRVLAQGGSAKTLAFFLCLVMLVTFVLQKTSGQLRKILEKDPRQAFAWVRMLGIVCSLLFLPFLWHENIITLYLAGMVFAVISFLSTLTVEAIMGQEVLQGRLNSNYASRILQTAMQIAAFLGASLAGLVLGFGGMKSVLLINVATYASGALIFSLLLKTASHVATKASIKISSVDRSSHATNQLILWITFIGLLLLTVQITAFNFLVPQIAQLEKAWTATQFGLIDAAAGLGAFLCTFVVIEKGPLAKLWIFSFIAILVADVSFHFIQHAYAMLTIVFMLGFFVNTFRIKQREFMYDAVSTTHELYEWTGRITVMTAFVKALLPLLLAFMLMKPSVNFITCGLIVGSGILLIEFAYYFVKRQSNLETLSDVSYIEIKN